MSGTTTCLLCGKLYQAYSEEEANRPDRSCGDHPAKKAPEGLGSAFPREQGTEGAIIIPSKLHCGS